MKCVVALLAAVLTIASARAGRADPVTPYPPGWPHRAPWKLNRELLLPETERIVFLVDVPRGAPPNQDALDHLAALAAKYGGREATWKMLGDPGVSSVQWILSADSKPVDFHLRVEGLLEDYRIPQHVEDTARLLAQVPACAAGPLPTNETYVFVRYLGAWGRSYGNARDVRVDPSCGARTFPVIDIAQDRLARSQAPGYSRSFLESRALAHEYGHVLGLGSNPEHGWWPQILSTPAGAHCVNHECAVAMPSVKALVRGRMLDYCTDCLADLVQAREHWIDGTVFPEVARLPQPDPVVLVAGLKDYNFRPGGKADRLLHQGKTVMPSLMRRLPQLPGKSQESPRSYAARLALALVVAEDEKRLGTGRSGLRYSSPKRDVSADLLVWWAQEADRFRAGDDWTLPPFLHVAP